MDWRISRSILIHQRIDMKTVEEIALAVCEKIGPVAMCKDPLAFSEMVVAAVDAERGKDATAWMLDTPNGVIRLEGFIGESQKCNDLWKPLFLSPTIPEGMAMVPKHPTPEIAKAFWDEYDKPNVSFVATYSAMIQAAGVTK